MSPKALKPHYWWHWDFRDMSEGPPALPVSSQYPLKPFTVGSESPGRRMMAPQPSQYPPNPFYWQNRDPRNMGEGPPALPESSQYPQYPLLVALGPRGHK